MKWGTGEINMLSLKARGNETFRSQHTRKRWKQYAHIKISKNVCAGVLESVLRSPRVHMVNVIQQVESVSRIMFLSQGSENRTIIMR